MAEKLGQNNIYSQFLGDKAIIRTYKGDELINEYKPLYNPPNDWSDIRVDCPENSIALYAGHIDLSSVDYVIKDGKLTWVNPNVYLESTGDNYIDTELVIDSNYSIDCLVDQTADTRFMYAFGTRYTDNQSFILATQYAQANQWFYRFGNQIAIVSPNIPHTGKHFLHLGNGSWTIDNKTGTFTQNTFTAGNSLYLFSANHPSYITSRSFIGKVYYFKIYDGETLVRHFVPVPKDLVIGNFTCPSNGMFDIIEQEFYGNSGTGSFTFGGADASDLNIITSNTYDNLGFTATMSASDLTTVGSPTITDGVASGFVQGQNRIEVAQVSNTMLNNFEFVTRANCNNSSLPLFYCYNTTFWLWINTTGKAFFRTNDLSSDIQISLPDSFNLNDYFNYKLKIKNNVVSFYFAEDNAEWQLVFEQEISTPTAFNRMLQIGNNSWWFASGTVFPGSIDLNNTYIKVDGAYFLMPYGSSNGYNVFIDGEQYGSTYASNAQCNIIWSTSGITTGDDITTPSALKAHKIWIEPATEGNNITAFHCARAADSGQELQGILWEHFNITNVINISALNASGSLGSQNYKNTLLMACTAKNNMLKVNGSLLASFFKCYNLEYLPVIDGNDSLINIGYYGFAECNNIKKINIKKLSFSEGSYAFYSCLNLEKLPKDIDYTNAQYMSNYLTYAATLKDTVLDVSAATSLTRIGCYGSSQRFMSGFKGLRVSNQAPFNNVITPQIDVSYTGMDRNALVQLFNDLPYNVGYEVVGSPTINNGVASGFSVNDYLTLNNTSNSTSWEIYTEFIFNYYDGYQGLLSMASPHFQVFVPNGNQYTLSLEHRNSAVESISSPQSMISGDKYSLSIKHNDGHYQTRLYNMTKQELNLEKEFDGTSVSLSGLLRFGITQTGNYYWHGSQDIANTYIKINNVYFFRGQPAMTKTLSCVGATGTADLTADDKNIALNKGWSLTLS